MPAADRPSATAIRRRRAARATPAATTRAASRSPVPRNASATTGASGGTYASSARVRRVLCHIKQASKKKSAAACVGDQCLEVREVALEGASALGGEPELGPR